MSSIKKIIFIGAIFILLIFTSALFLIIPKIKIDIIGNKDIVLNIGEEYIDQGAKAYLQGLNTKKLNVETKGIVNTAKPGTYIITYNSKYKSTENDAIRIIRVVDRIAPVITLNKPIIMCEKNNLIEIDATVIDNYDGDISDTLKYKINNNKIIIFAIDSSNNKIELIDEVKYNDSDKPKITLNGNQTIYLTLGETYNEPGVTAYDSCDGNITNKIKINGSVNTSELGTYEIIYSVRDSAGNIVSTKRVINVVENNTIVNNAIIYLTFDDGPGPYTEQILDILKDNNIKATFFVTNQFGSKYQYIIKKEYEAGHTVGIHTYSHKWSIYDTVETYLDDFSKIKDIVVEQTGVEPKYFRFPGGTSNHVAKTSMKNLAKLMTEKGYIYFDWSVSVEDAGSCTKKKKDTEKEKCILNYFKEGIDKNKNSIVLMHDIKKNTLNALPDMISYAKSKGYEFKAIDDTTPFKQFAPYK